MNVLEFNSGECVLVNGAYMASFNMLVEIDGVRTRHYYGTLIPQTVPGGYPAVQHDAVMVLLETSDLLAMALQIAQQIAANALTPAL